jgi:hypothetical protein
MSNYKGFPTEVKRFPHRDASRSDGSWNAFRIALIRMPSSPSAPALRCQFEQGMRTAKLQTVIGAALMGSGP